MRLCKYQALATYLTQVYMRRSHSARLDTTSTYLQHHNLEWKTLIASIRISLDLLAPQNADGKPSNQCNWHYLAQLALDQGVTALLGNQFGGKSPAIPSDLADAADTFIDSLRADNEKRTSSFVEVAKSLQLADVPIIPIKGPLLAETAYGDLGCRVFWDFDFLFHKSKIQQLTTALEDIGFSQEVTLSPRQMEAYWAYSGQAVFRRTTDQMALEPHTRFTPATLAVNIDYGHMWNQAIHKEWRGINILTLTPEDEFILLCTHGAKESWCKLKYIADLAFFLRSQPNLNWEVILEHAHSQGILRMVLVAMTILEKMLNYPVPPIVLELKAKDTTTRKIAKQLCCTQAIRTPISVYKISSYQIASRERITNKFKYIWKTLTIPREKHYKSICIPDSWFFLYTPFKVLHDGIALPLWKLLRPILRRG